MWLIDVIPIARGIFKDTLTYRARQQYRPGSLMHVPVRNREVPALVTACESVQNRKAQIKDAGHAIKPIAPQEEHHLLRPSFIRAASATAHEHAATPGAILHQLIPKAILEAPTEQPQAGGESASASNTAHERVVLQAPADERFSHYRNLVREEFARSSSVVLCVSTVQEAEEATAYLQKGIEQYVIALHSNLTKKQVRDRWHQALTTDHPLLIIMTPTYLSLPRPDFGTYIVEHESARAFKQQSRPYLDVRTAVEHITRESGARLMLADMLLRVETLHRYYTGEFDEFAPIKLRPAQNRQVRDVVIDMRPQAPKAGEPAHERQPFQVLSDELVELIHYSANTRGGVFCFAARRGLASMTVCQDCGAIVTCTRCSAPVVLHQRGDERIFACHKCGTERNADENCAACDGWRLKELGVGSQRVLEALYTQFPDRPLFAIERDAVTTHKQARDVARAFYETPGAIMVGTEMALPYLSDTVPISAITSIDSLLSLPDVRVHERVFHLSLTIRSLASHTFLMQTRQPDLPLINRALAGNINDFYRDEIQQRELFGYPPFRILIKITIEGTKRQIASDTAYLQDYLATYEPFVYPAFTHLYKGRYQAHALISVSNDRWPDTALIHRLQQLPPQCAVNVSPETTL
jgi:primosomal protein N' (replication factor Y)